MNSQEERRAGRHPGKMPEGLKLADCVRELEAIFGRMTISDRDRGTRAHIGMTNIAAGMEFYDPAARAPYVDSWYLGEAARGAIGNALTSGQLPAWTDYDGKFVELVPSTLFSPNKWIPSRTVLTGTYVALNVAHGRDGPTRAECDGATLWVREDDWPRIREELIVDRGRRFGSVLPGDMSQLLHGFLETSACISPTLRYKAAPPDPQWSLYESVAWLGARDADLVESQQHHHFPGTTAKNYGAVAWIRLEQSLADRRGLANDILTADDARGRLLAACETGRVLATGIPADQSDRRVISANDFVGAELWEGRGGSLHRVVAGRTEAARWYDLRFRTRDVQLMTTQAAEQPEPSASAPPVPAGFATKKASEEWYRERVAEADAARVTYSRREDELAGRKRGIRRVRMRELRAAHAPHWTTGGAPTAEEQAKKRQFLIETGQLGE